ncbi:MAG: serine/threonine protein kinase [Kangiellaceae bacterium]|nr:serine/threonine protein kinase [Kangiellaceae bacterium]
MSQSFDLEQAHASQQHPFEKLTPDFVLDAVESFGYVSDGRMLTLNSYENRVYQIGIEDKEPIIAKFYRPNRWSTIQILEEHQFCDELVEHELPVVAPIKIDGQSLFHYQGFDIAFFKRRGGYAPELDNLDNLFTMGRFLGRIHAIGKAKSYQCRPTLDVDGFGRDSVDYIIEHAVPMELKTAYQTLAEDVLGQIYSIWNDYGAVETIRTHGDCHPGNILWRDDNPHFVDFDDSRMAPAVQDIWMLLSGDRSSQLSQLSEIIDGYQEFCDFNSRELRLVECLRTLRMLHHSAWIAQRWQDPAFPQAFPWFNSMNYWEQQILDLRVQFAELQEPALTLSF